MSSVYYHHTDNDSARKIYESQMIKQSVGSGGADAVYGNGVYLTKLGPDHSKQSVAINNFDGPLLWERKLDEGKLDALIAVKLPDAKVKAVNTIRDIYLYPGDLPFSEAQGVEFFMRNGNTVVNYKP